MIEHTNDTLSDETINKLLQNGPRADFCTGLWGAGSDGGEGVAVIEGVHLILKVLNPKSEVERQG